MIEYLKGSLAELAPALAIVECHGVGYGVNISLNTFSGIQGKESVKKIEVSIEKLRTNGMATIEGDVKAGDQVVTSGVHHISDGEKVRLLVPVSKTNVGGLL